MRAAYVFSPSQRVATSLGEFIEACQADPHLAAEHLRAGYFEAWLNDAGQRDLADAAARIRISGVVALDGLEQFVRVALESLPRSRARRSRNS